MGKLLNVVDQTVQFPLSVDFAPTPQGKSIKAFVIAQATEYWFDRREAAGDHLSTLIRIDLPFHPVSMGFITVAFALEKCNLPRLGFLRRAQTLSPEGARQAISLGAPKLHRCIAIEGAVRTVRIESFASRAETVRAILGKLEVTWTKPFRDQRLSTLIPEWIGLGLVCRLPMVAFVAFAVAVVGKVGIDAFCRQHLEVVFRMIASVSGNNSLIAHLWLDGLDHWNKQFLF